LSCGSNSMAARYRERRKPREKGRFANSTRPEGCRTGSGKPTYLYNKYIYLLHDIMFSLAPHGVYYYFFRTSTPSPRTVLPDRVLRPGLLQVFLHDIISFRHDPQRRFNRELTHCTFYSRGLRQ